MFPYEVLLVKPNSVYLSNYLLTDAGQSADSRTTTPNYKVYCQTI